MAHVRHDEGRGLRSKSAVGNGRAGEKRRKETWRAEASVRGRRNKSVRPCRRSPLRGHSFTVRFFFFTLPLPMSAAASIPKRMARNERTSRVAARRAGKKKRAREREREGTSDGEGESERAEEIRHACYARAWATCAMAVESVENESK